MHPNGHAHLRLESVPGRQGRELGVVLHSLRAWLRAFWFYSSGNTASAPLAQQLAEDDEQATKGGRGLCSSLVLARSMVCSAAGLVGSPKFAGVAWRAWGCSLCAFAAALMGLTPRLPAILIQ